MGRKAAAERNGQSTSAKGLGSSGLNPKQKNSVPQHVVLPDGTKVKSIAHCGHA